MSAFGEHAVIDGLVYCSAWNVSRNWREIVAQDKKANERRKLYIIQLKADAQVIWVTLPRSGL